MISGLRRPAVMYGAVASLVAVIVYANSLANGFALDDNFIILTNQRVRSPDSIGDIWLNPYWTFAGEILGLYRPGIISLYALQWAVSDGSPMFFHAMNVALHAVMTLAVLALARRFVSLQAAFVGAVLFAVHPVHTEAVANVVGQAEIVAALAVVAACLVHSGRDGVAVSWRRQIALVLLFGLALTTKESAVVLPALLIICDLAQKRMSPTPAGFARYADAVLMPLLLLSATLALYLIFRFEALGGSVIGSDAAPALPFLREEYRVLNALRAFPEFLRLLVWPIDLSSDYSPAALLPVETVRPMVVLGAALLLGLIVLALMTPWLPLAGLPAAWFLISILTVSNLFFPIGVLIAERTLYLPSVAVSLAIAFVWNHRFPRASLGVQRAVIGVTAVAVMLLGVRTWIRNPVWDSTQALWESLEREKPESYRTQWTMAVRAWDEDRPREAEARFQFAYRLYPQDSQLLVEYGNFLVSRGRFAEALPLLERAYEMHPWITRTSVILMHVYLAVGRYNDAVDVSNEAQLSGAPVDLALAVRAYAYQQAGDLDNAIASWRVAATNAPDENWRLRGSLARAEAAAGLDSAAAATVAAARPFAADSTGTRVLDSVQRAIAEGCYRRAAADLAEVAPLPPDRPLGVECDQLGHWFDFILARQSASSLQNATDGVVH